MRTATGIRNIVLPITLALLLLAPRRGPAAEAAPEGPVLQLSPQGLDLRRATLQTDVTGSRVRVVPAAGAAIAFSLVERVLRAAPIPDSTLQPPRQAAPGLDLIFRPGGPVRLLGAEVPLPAGACCLAVDPDGRGLLIGAGTTLVSLSGDGAERWRAALPAPVAAVHVSGDGRLALAALGDGTVRWYGAAAGQPLLALFLHRGGKRWVAFTPSGYYDAAGGGEELLGWSVPRGGGPAPDFFRIGLFRERFHRPDLIGRVVFVQDEPRALEELNAESGRRPGDVPLRRLLPPVVRILDPPANKVVSEKRITVRFTVHSPSGEPATWRIFVRGKSTATRGAPRLFVPGPVDPAGLGETEHKETVDLLAEDQTVVVVAETGLSTGEPALLPLRWEGKREARPAARPDLYVLAVGVSEYWTERLHLDFAAKDARDLAAAFAAQQGKRYRHAEVRVLTDRGARRADIMNGLEWLRRQATPADVSVVSFAGHGTNDPATGRYSLLPQDADPGRPETQLGGDALQRALARVPGKVLLFLDTCHAGNLRGPRGAVDLGDLTDKLASVESSVVVFAAASEEQTSRESLRWGNGVFTKAVVEGLRGQADYRGTGEVRVSALESYVSERVRALTHEDQTPTSAKPGTVPDFLVALVKPRYALEKKWWFWGAVGVAAAGIVTGSLLATKPWLTRLQF